MFGIGLVNRMESPVAFALLNLGPEQSYVDSVPNQPATLRSYFPETWLWELVPTGYA